MAYDTVAPALVANRPVHITVKMQKTAYLAYPQFHIAAYETPQPHAMGTDG